MTTEPAMKKVVTYERADGTKVRAYLRRPRRDQKPSIKKEEDERQAER